MSYANMDGVPTQTAGVSEILASDWNTYVRDNFDSIKSGHIVCTSSTRPSGVQEGTMIYETDSQKVLVYTGASWVEVNDLDRAGGVPETSPGHLIVADDSAKSALTPIEGMMVYQSDNDKTFVYNGSAWVEIAPNSVVSSLPGSPVDGQVIYYQNAAMATAGVVWSFRYRSGGGTYKWEFIGGPPLTYTDGSEWVVTSTTAYRSALTVPLDGSYMLVISHNAWSSFVGNFMTFFVVTSAGTTNLIPNGSVQGHKIDIDEREAGSNGQVVDLSAGGLRFALTSTNTQGRSVMRFMRLLPIRVG